MTINSYGTCISDNGYLSENTLRPETDTQNYSLPKNIIYLEFFGSTQFYFSLNYERTLYSIKKNYFSLRIGINRDVQGVEYNLYIPLSVNYQYRIKNSSLFEIGLGPVYWHQEISDRDGNDIHNRLYYVANIGFRFIIGEHFFIRPNCNFYYYYYSNRRKGEIWPGLSLGVAF